MLNYNYLSLIIKKKFKKCAGIAPISSEMLVQSLMLYIYIYTYTTTSQQQSTDFPEIIRYTFENDGNKSLKLFLQFPKEIFMNFISIDIFLHYVKFRTYTLIQK